MALVLAYLSYLIIFVVDQFSGITIMEPEVETLLTSLFSAKRWNMALFQAFQVA